VIVLIFQERPFARARLRITTPVPAKGVTDRGHPFPTRGLMPPPPPPPQAETGSAIHLPRQPERSLGGSMCPFWRTARVTFTTDPGRCGQTECRRAYTQTRSRPLSVHLAGCHMHGSTGASGVFVCLYISLTDRCILLSLSWAASLHSPNSLWPIRRHRP